MKSNKSYVICSFADLELIKQSYYYWQYPSGKKIRLLPKADRLVEKGTLHFIVRGKYASTIKIYDSYWEA